VDSSGSSYIVGSTNSGLSNDDVMVTKLNASGTAIVYNTLIGDTCNDTGASVAVDSTGNAYVTGQVVFRDQFNLCTQEKVFVSKLNLTGQQIFGVAFGGPGGDDTANDIAVDAAANIYVTGHAAYADFPTTPNAYQTNGYSGAFVSKIDPTGTYFVYSTYVGGGITHGYGIVVDSQGNAHIAGSTQSGSFPVTPTAYQLTHTGFPLNAFATKLNSTGTALLYSTFLGGDTADTANEIALDSQGNMYLAGTTQSADFPTTPGAFDRACGTDGMCNPVLVCTPTCRYETISDAFVAKINPFLSGVPSLVYSTFLGGMNRDDGFGIAVNSAGNAWVTGRTAANSVSFPLINSFQPEIAGDFDAFVAELNPTASGLLLSTYLGGSSYDEGGSIAVDSAGNAYVAGGTTSTNFRTQSPMQPANNGGNDAFIAKIGVGAAGPVLNTVTVNPATVTGAGTSTGTVSLSAAAPAGGVLVTLASSNTSAATVPASVSVPAGAVSATFSITVNTVTSTSTVAISGVYSGVTKSANLTVNPPAATVSLLSITLSPTTIVGGKNSTGTAKLTAAAPAGGALVSLSSSNTAIAAVPASVAIPAGATSATFAVTTTPASSTASATISGTMAGTTKSASLTVSAATISAISVSPATVTGGKTATGKVTLTGAAPAGGIAVTLASSDAAVAPVPASVTVAAGATYATFNIAATVVTSNQSVTISGTQGGITKSTTLVVAAPALSSITVPTTAVCGCKPATGKVTLTGVAPAGGATVSLTSALAPASVPATVLVPAGATTANFTINTIPVAATATGAVTATYGAVTKSANLTVRPIGVASVALSPNPVVGPAPVSGTVTLECPAAPSAITVSLATNNAAVAQPSVASITVAGGTATKTFGVTTTDVTVVSSATITAAANGLAKTKALTVNP
jgi:hypothetical protein